MCSVKFEVFATDNFSTHFKKYAGPLKHCYAKEHNLNFEELMSDGAYKEQYRSDMVTWSEELRFVFFKTDNS